MTKLIKFLEDHYVTAIGLGIIAAITKWFDEIVKMLGYFSSLELKLSAILLVALIIIGWQANLIIKISKKFIRKSLVLNKINTSWQHYGSNRYINVHDEGDFDHLEIDFYAKNLTSNNVNITGALLRLNWHRQPFKGNWHIPTQRDPYDEWTATITERKPIKPHALATVNVYFYLPYSGEAKNYKGSVALIDDVGTEYWLHGLEFRYQGRENQ